MLWLCGRRVRSGISRCVALLPVRVCPVSLLVVVTGDLGPDEEAIVDA